MLNKIIINRWKENYAAPPTGLEFYKIGKLWEKVHLGK